MNDKPKELGVK